MLRGSLPVPKGNTALLQPDEPNPRLCMTTHLNSSGRRDYRLFYNEKTKKIVAEYFKEDIDLFGYTFDGYKPGYINS